MVTGDIRDPHFCLRITRDIDIVFHLAALIAIPYSYVAPDSYVDTNVKGTLNICQAALTNRCERVVHTSTSEVYGTARYTPMDENHPLQPQSPYSASKIGADMIAMSFFHAFALPVVVARPFNTYGPRQSARAVIPTIITQVLSGAKTLSLGDPRPTRDFVYVEDTCQAMIALAEAQESVGSVVNIGTNAEISIGDLASCIAELTACEVEMKIAPERMRPETSEVFRLRCNNERLTQLTGFTPGISLRDGLARTIDWFRNPRNMSKYKADIYNV